MDKLQLAHEYALKIIETHKDMLPAAKCVASYSFDYAEAMLAEEEKRKDKSRPDVIEKVDKDDNLDWVDEIEKRGLAD